MSDLMHYGTPRHSGRYPWGSGKNPQRNKNILTRYNELKAQGFSDADIAKGFGMKSASELKARVYNAKNEIKKEKMESAFNMIDDGKNNSEIAERLGVTEGAVRAWKKMGREEALGRRDENRRIADILKNAVDEKGFIDVGSGTEIDLGVNENRKKMAIDILKDEGYTVHNVQVDQQGTKNGQKTTIQVLAPPGTEWKEAAIAANDNRIRTVVDHAQDPSEFLIKKTLPPVESISSSRIQIRYGEEGGLGKDGVIELRRGLEDLNLGSAKYAQVRIGVDDKLYLKGMAMYSDNLPPGIDVIFNTNKSKDTPFEKVLKPMKKNEAGEIDKDNPFGASIKPQDDLRRVPRTYIGSDGKEHVSPINVVNEEGDWGEWSRTLASQMLSKQPLQLAKRQLNLSYDIRKSEFDEIMSLTNPVVKKKLLEEYASDCDSTAVHLKAAALPRQQSKVILPIPSLKDNEIYAPGYKQGEMVALVRYPHQGTFEIPILKVNNSNKEARSIMNNAADAVGINSHSAEKLSGADFDGDTVLVIPTGGTVKIKTSKRHELLYNEETGESFDPKSAYAIKNREEREAAGEKLPKRMSSEYKQREMGVVSNLVTDMQITGANTRDIALATKYAQVVIDAEKHDLDFRQAKKDCEIDRLRKEYQRQSDGSTGGAATLLSRAKSEVRVDTRKEVIPKKEFRESDTYKGEKLYEIKKGDTYLDENGVQQHRKMKSTQMAETNDARTLISDYNTAMEREYATYANRLKSLANDARKAYYMTENPKRDPAAAKKYAEEVESLNRKLKIAQENAPRERQAQLLANKIVSMKIAEYPEDSRDKDWLKKRKNEALRTARATYGASKEQVIITPREWEAIQNKAIGSTNLNKILNNADMTVVKKMAMPKGSRGITDSQARVAKQMSDRGYTLEEIASRFGVSSSTISKAIE